MLSYQHGYHAGNLADVHKHALLAWMMAYMTGKDKPLTYLETHAGRALYDLESAEARKTGEAAVERVTGWFGEAHPYARVLEAVRGVHGAMAYPGSPMIAGELLRPGDRIALAELHPQEHRALEAAMAPYGAEVRREDGLKMALSLSPPEPRRGLLLCDPSYEVKAEYEVMGSFLAKLARRWPVGVLVLWYPILAEPRHAAMVRHLRAALREVFVHEVRFPPVREGHRMVGSGLAVVNPPWGLEDEAARLGGLFAGL